MCSFLSVFFSQVFSYHFVNRQPLANKHSQMGLCLQKIEVYVSTVMYVCMRSKTHEANRTGRPKICLCGGRIHLLQY